MKISGNSLPSVYADKLGVEYSKNISTPHKKMLGQFFTPLKIALFMANYVETKKNEYEILDPGFGTGMLSCAIIEHLINTNNNLKKIKLTVYEIDPDIISFAKLALRYLQKWLIKKEIVFTFKLKNEDFVTANAKALIDHTYSLYPEEQDRYDVIISNPPYFKVPKDDLRAKVTKSINHGQPNIYSMFMGISANLLKENGEMIFITPRSFSSGSYFRLFRENFFEKVRIKKVHLFNSRNKAFKRDNVLQENIILKAIPKNDDDFTNKIIISTSSGLHDLDKCLKQEYEYNELIDLNGHQKILHLPASSKEADVIKLFKKWEENLSSFNIEISTGPVVPFRAKKFIHKENHNKVLVPLLWLHNTRTMEFIYPLFKKNKGQYIEASEKTRHLLIPNKNYVFLRRFSSKDDKSRLIATPYFSKQLNTELLGIENHLNYIYRPQGELLKEEVMGIAAILNSTLFDIYFRTFNGNTQVSATELREMMFPPLSIIKEIGYILLNENDISQERIDKIIHRFLEMEQNFAAIHE